MIILFLKKIIKYFFFKLVISIFFLTTNLYSLSISYIFELSGGLNFFISDQDALKSKIELDELKKTTALAFHIRNGVVLFDHLIFSINYSYLSREVYYYRDNYFYLNESTLEEKKYHTLQAFTEYSFFKYSESNTISLALGGGWIRKYHGFSTIKNLSSLVKDSDSNIIYTPSIPKILSYDEVILTTGLRFYQRLREEGTIFFGIDYSLLVPSLEHFPNIYLGIALNIELIHEEKLINSPLLEEVKPLEEIESVAPNSIEPIDKKNEN